MNEKYGKIGPAMPGNLSEQRPVGSIQEEINMCADNLSQAMFITEGLLDALRRAGGPEGLPDVMLKRQEDVESNGVKTVLGDLRELRNRIDVLGGALDFIRENFNQLF